MDKSIFEYRITFLGDDGMEEESVKFRAIVDRSLEEYEEEEEAFELLSTFAENIIEEEGYEDWESRLINAC